MSKEKNIAALEAKVELLEVQNEALEQHINSASIVTEAAPQKGALPEFTYNGQAFKFKIPGFSLDGASSLLAADVVNDEVLLELIVTTYPGLIEEL